MTQDPESFGTYPPEDAEGTDAGDVAEVEDPIPHHAFYSPEDPIARSEGEIPREALFSPDDPLKRSDPSEGVVTRLDGGVGTSPDEVSSLSWKLRTTADLMEALARDLREHGLGALKVRPDTEPMDAMIRSFVAGYLVGKLEEEA